MKACPNCGYVIGFCICNMTKIQTSKEVILTEEGIQPRPKGREVTHPRYDLIPGFFKQMLAEIFTDGVAKYGEKNWMDQPSEFYRDCLNHAQVHLDKFNDGDHSENQLAKVAWNVLAALWYYKIGYDILGRDKPTITLNMERYINMAQTAAQSGDFDRTRK